MGQLNFKNALVSVSDKTGLIEFIKPLVDQGLRVLSTGGTAKHLKEAGIPVEMVSEQTGFPEVMDGRVKTLHPNIHMCLLARGHEEKDLETLKENKLEPIDLVIGNLYPFESALVEGGLDDRAMSEFIDIGGPSFLRAAAKNYERIAVICNPSDYKSITEKGEITLDDRKKLAAKVFAHTSSYDAMIATQMSADIEQFSLSGHFVQELRYGENPQQKAAWFRQRGQAHGLHEAEILQGKALSYNNILDLEAACTTLAEFTETCVVSVKHNNPCGVGIGETGDVAVKASLAGDPVSVFGGIVASNVCIDKPMAEQMTSLFLECVIAPEVSEEAKIVFSKKKNLRVLIWPELTKRKPNFQVKSVAGGFLVQEADKLEVWGSEWKVIGEQPTEDIRKAAALSWRVCAHLKSNAIAIASSQGSLGLGMGQVNRVDAVAQAIERMETHHPNSKEAVLASDAFFPFPDSIEKAAEAGIKWVIQPGGSIKDDEVIKKAEQLGVNLILTGRRHFKH